MEHSLSIELQDLPSESTANGNSVSNVAATGGQAGLENEEVSERIDVTCFMQPAAQRWVRFGSFHWHGPSTTYCASCCECFELLLPNFIFGAFCILHIATLAETRSCYSLNAFLAREKMYGSASDLMKKALSSMFSLLLSYPVAAVDCWVHLMFLTWEPSLKFDSAGLFSRRQHVRREPVALRRNSFCLGIAASVCTLGIVTFWDCVCEHQTFFAWWVGFRMLLLPLFLQPYIGTVLLLELEMRELTVRLEEVVDSNDVLPCHSLLEKIANVKAKWARFLRLQFFFGMLGPGIYGVLVFFTVTDREVAKDPLARGLFFTTLDAPFQLTSVCLHCSFLAMFNARVLKWQQETENNDIYRFLCQKESEFCFSILGYSVTVAKVRFSLISLLLTVLSRLAQKFILFLQDH